MSDAEPEYSAHEQRQRDPGRLLAFTDGVFAIIITILVLELKVPELSAGHPLRESLEEIRPTFLAFALSFLLVGMYWAWHRTEFAEVRFINFHVVWLNLLFLLPAAMIPFAASVLGKYETNAVALHLYGAVMIAVTLFRVLLDWYLRRHPGLLWDTESGQTQHLRALTAGLALVVYVLAMAVAGVLPRLSFALYFGVPVLYLVLVTVLARDPKTRAAAQDL